MVSFLDCQHRNVQQFTEFCFDCGYNVYTTKEEYLADLRRRARVDEKEIRRLEQLLRGHDDE